MALSRCRAASGMKNSSMGIRRGDELPFRRSRRRINVRMASDKRQDGINHTHVLIGCHDIYLIGNDQPPQWAWPSPGSAYLIIDLPG
jgi:hypothetical protein